MKLWSWSWLRRLFTKSPEKTKQVITRNFHKDGSPICISTNMYLDIVSYKYSADSGHSRVVDIYGNTFWIFSRSMCNNTKKINTLGRTVSNFLVDITGKDVGLDFNPVSVGILSADIQYELDGSTYHNVEIIVVPIREVTTTVTY